MGVAKPSTPTREQIGAALGYANPRESIKNIHMRHRERLDQLSVVLKLRVAQTDTPSGGAQDTILYTRKGIMEICRWSQQPKEKGRELFALALKCF